MKKGDTIYLLIEEWHKQTNGEPQLCWYNTSNTLYSNKEDVVSDVTGLIADCLNRGESGFNIIETHMDITYTQKEYCGKDNLRRKFIIKKMRLF